MSMGTRPGTRASLPGAGAAAAAVGATAAATAGRGSSFIPHFGQRAFGSSEVTSGCMGQWYLCAAVFGSVGALAAGGAAFALAGAGAAGGSFFGPALTKSMLQMGHWPG